MSISGNIKTMAAAELLQWLATGQKTGTLVIDKGDDKVVKRIFFDDGDIISSSSTDPKEYLGRFLVSHGFVTQEAVDAAVARQKDEGKLLGQILIDMGAMSKDDLSQMLHLKAEETIYDIFTWPQGAFEFLDGELPEKQLLRIKVDVQWIVLEGTRRKDEWNRIQAQVPSPECVPVTVVDVDTLEIDEVEKRILQWIDDERSVDEISGGSMTGLFQVAEIIAKYVMEGMVKVVRPRVIEVKVPVPMEEGSKAEIETGKAKVPEDSGMYQLAMLQQMAQMSQMMGQVQNMMPIMGQQPQGQMQQMQQAAPAQAPPAAAGGNNPAGLDVGGKTLNFAGGGGADQPASAAPAAAGTEAGRLVQEATQALKAAKLDAALKTVREAKDADGADDESIKIRAIEEKIHAALERAGVSLDKVPKLKVDMGELANLDLSPQEGFMLTRVDGSYDIKSILKMSPMPQLDAQMLFWRLRKSGHVAF
ncbi:MAG: DUF4388 domain-containing protein [Thermoanaerobaculia bacterium]|nr:DUF4388 domain-containing protein [Thermoanaerobaculia bacterium]